MEDHENVEARFAEIVEVGSDTFLLCCWVFLDTPPHAFKKKLQRRPGRIVIDLNDQPLPIHLAHGQVFYRRIDHRAVRQRYRRVVGCSDSRAAEAYVLDCALITADADPMADAE